MPQSMQRAPWSRSSGSASGSAYSSKSFTRSGIGRLRWSTRWISRKPPSLPMAREHLLGGVLLGGRLRRLVGARLARGLAGALRRHRRVLVLAGLARLARLLVAVGGRRVRGWLAHVDRTRAVAVAAGAHDRRLAGLERLLLGQLAQRPLVVHRHDLHPGAAQLVPAPERALGDCRAGALEVLGHQGADLLEVLVSRLLELDQLGVAARREGPLGIEHVGDAAAHAGGEVASRRPEHDDPAAGHVLAAVVADALYHRAHTRVAHAEALAREAAEEGAPGRGAVQHGVADHHVLLRH